MVLDNYQKVIPESVFHTVTDVVMKLAVTEEELFGQAKLFRLKGELLLGQSDQSIQEAEECLCEAIKNGVGSACNNA